jgi:uncharacterized protein
MPVLDDLLSTLNPCDEVRDVRVGPFQIAVQCRNCGIASTPFDVPHAEHQSPVREAGGLLGKDGLELAGLTKSESVLEAAIGMAALNALLEVNEKDCVHLNGRDLLLQKGRDKKVALVGHFPFIPELRAAADELWVLEKRPREGDLPESESERLIPEADVVGITGTAFTNHTIDGLLKICKPSAFVVVLGGSAPLSRVLFEYHIDAVSGSKVVDSDLVLRSVSQGATFPQLKGLLRLTMMK